MRSCRPRVGALSGPGLCFIVLLSGCSVESKTNPAPDSASSRVDPALSDSVRVSIHTPAEVRAGGAVPIEVQIENVSAKTLALNLQGRDIAFDIIITTADGRPTWRRLEHQTLQAILRMETLAPGQVLRLEASWTAAGPGDYLISAVIPTDADPLRGPAVPLRVRN